MRKKKMMRKKDEKKDEDDVSESLLPISWACTVGSCQVLFVNLTSPQPLSLLYFSVIVCILFLFCCGQFLDVCFSAYFVCCLFVCFLVVSLVVVVAYSYFLFIVCGLFAFGCLLWLMIRLFLKEVSVTTCSFLFHIWAPFPLHASICQYFL